MLRRGLSRPLARLGFDVAGSEYSSTISPVAIFERPVEWGQGLLPLWSDWSLNSPLQLTLHTSVTPARILGLGAHIGIHIWGASHPMDLMHPPTAGPLYQVVQRPHVHSKVLETSNPATSGMPSDVGGKRRFLGATSVASGLVVAKVVTRNAEGRDSFGACTAAAVGPKPLRHRDWVSVCFR